MIANYENKVKYNELLFVRHPLPGFEPRSPPDALDRSAMGPTLNSSFVGGSVFKKHLQLFLKAVNVLAFLKPV